jgi:hypothetical protein
MIIEQAFYNLPEILCGSRYPRQEYESGLIVAFTLAILQELNGRNARNPLSYFQAERLYRSRGNFPRSDTPRPLRADLFVNIRGLGVGNRKLRQYGWRFNNWLEAKFFRGQTDNGRRHSGNKTNYTAGVIEDLLRLSILVYENPPSRSCSSRYFLHVYDSDPKLYLPFRNRRWLRNLTQPGIQQVDLDNLDDEVSTVKNIIGDITDVAAYLMVFNQVIVPRYWEHFPAYYCILSRLDHIKVRFNDFDFEITPEGYVNESGRWAYKTIVGHLASNIHLQESDQSIDALDTDDEYDDPTVEMDESTEYYDLIEEENRDL